jgi:hypothetical protein
MARMNRQFGELISEGVYLVGHGRKFPGRHGEQVYAHGDLGSQLRRVGPTDLCTSARSSAARSNHRC